MRPNNLSPWSPAVAQAVVGVDSADSLTAKARAAPKRPGFAIRAGKKTLRFKAR
jgi:hypothetical protein